MVIPEAELWGELLDPQLMERPRAPGEISLEELIDVLGGAMEAPTVSFTSEGGFHGCEPA